MVLKVIVILLVAVIIATGGVYYLKTLKSPTSVEDISVTQQDKIVYERYDGIAYPVVFNYPSNLELSQGDTAGYSVIRLWDSSGEDLEIEFDLKIHYDKSADQIIKTYQNAGFVLREEVYVDGLTAVVLKGDGSPNAGLPDRLTTKIVVHVVGKTYEISDWRGLENENEFKVFLDSIRFIEKR